MKKYYPILLSKKGELVALQHLAQTVKDEISPVIELLQETLEKKVKDENGKVVAISYNDDFEKFLKLHWSFFGNQLILDFSLFADIEAKIHEIRRMVVSLINAGVNIILTVQRNSRPILIETVKELIHEHRTSCCLKTSENSGGFDNFKNDIDILIDQLEIELSRIVLLLDLGYAKADNHNLLGTIAKISIMSLTQKRNKWLDIVVASGSFPEDLGKFQPAHNVFRIERFEWKIWTKINLGAEVVDLKYADFGTKHPIFIDVNYAASVSIKYTTAAEFIIYKGELTENHDDGHGQYIIHAAKLIKTPDYSGKNFSWGDLKINEIANEDIKDDKRKTGSSTTWVQISQNHHITLINSLL